MLAIEVTINILWLPLIAIIFALAGFLFRGGQIEQSKKRIIYLENEMLNNHTEILKLQQALVELERNMPQFKALVVSMKESIVEENTETPEVAAQRKKVSKSP